MKFVKFLIKSRNISRKEKNVNKVDTVKQQQFSNSLFTGPFTLLKIIKDLQRVVCMLHLSIYTIAENKTKKKFIYKFT